MPRRDSGFKSSFQADTDALLWYRVLSSQHSKFSQPKLEAGFCLIIYL
jgi:hypothetical protein